MPEQNKDREKIIREDSIERREVYCLSLLRRLPTPKLRQQLLDNYLAAMDPEDDTPPKCRPSADESGKVQISKRVDEAIRKHIKSKATSPAESERVVERQPRSRQGHMPS